MKLRQRWRVAWDDGDPVVVRTTALDTSVAADHTGDPTLQSLAVVHHALEREGHGPPDLVKWAEVLDEFTPIDADGRPAIGSNPAGDFLYDDPDETIDEIAGSIVKAVAAATGTEETGPTGPGRTRGARSRSRS